MEELFEMLSSNTQLLEGISPEEFGEQFKDENSLGELFDIVNEANPDIFSGIERDGFISEFTPKQGTSVDNMSDETQAYLGLSDFKSVDDYILAAAQQQEAQQVLEEGNAFDLSDAANIFTWDFLSNNYKAGIIQGKIGNLHEIGINTITDDPTTLDPDFFGKSAALYRHQQEISQKLEEGRTGERNAGRFLSDVVGGIISSPVAAVREMVSDVDGVAPLLLSLIPGMQSVGVQTAFGLAGADVEAGAIMTDKIQEYANEKGIDITTEEGWREVYQDTEFIAQAKKDAAIGGAIVGVAEGFSGFAAGKVGRAASEITSMKQVGYNFAGRLAVGAAFDGAGEASKQMYLDGEIDGWEVAVEAGSGPAQSIAMTFFETRSDRRAITDNRIADDILENERNGSIRPRDEGARSTSIEGEANTTPEEEQAALEAADAQNQAQETQGVTEATTPSTPTTPVTPPSPPERVTAKEVEAVRQAGQRKREALNTIPDQAIEDHLDGSPQNTIKLVEELAKRGGLKSERKAAYVELAQDLSAAIKKLPENLRNAQTDNDKAKARDVVQSMLNRQSLQGKLHMAEQAAKTTEEGINKKELKRVAKVEKELATLNKHIVDIVNDDTFTLADYDATTFMLREVQNETEDNLRPDRSKVEVRGNTVEVNDPTIYAGIERAVEKINKNNANVDDFTPFELTPLEIQQEAPLAVQEDTFTIDITSPTSTVESGIGEFTVNVDPRVARITPSESFASAPVGQQENTLFQAGKELEAQRKRLVADDLSILSEDTIAAWNNLVSKGEATFTKKGGYRMRTDAEARKIADKKIRERGVKLNATKEVADVRQRKLDDRGKARQLKTVLRGVKSNATKTPLVKVLSDNDFRALAPRENSNDIAYVEDLDSDVPVIYINSEKQRASTLPHEMAHVLIADKLGTEEQRKDIVVKLSETLKGVLATSEIASEQALLDQLQAFVDKYEGDNDVLAEEFLAELSAFLVVNESRLTPRKQITKRILRAINRAISRLIGVSNVLENVDDVNEAIDFINGLADELSGQKNVDQVIVSPVTRKTRTKKTIKVEGDKAVLVALAPGEKKSQQTFTVGKNNIYYTNREVAGNQTNDVEMSPLTLPKGVRKKAQMISALNTFIEKMDNAGIPIVITPSLQSEQRFYASFGFTLSGDGKTMSRGVLGETYILPEEQPFADFAEDTPTVEELIEEASVPTPTPTATTKRRPTEGETFLYDGVIYTARNVKGSTFDGIGDNGAGIKGATIQDTEFEGVNVVNDQGDVRRQLDDDINSDEQDFIDEVLGSRFYSVEEKEALLKEFGVENVTVKDTTFTANRTSPQTPVKKIQQTIPNSDAANDATLTDEELTNGVFTINGEKISFERIEGIAKKLGTEFKGKTERQSFLTQYAIAYKRGWVDPPGRMKMNTSNTITHLANGGSVNEYQIMGLRQTFNDMVDKVDSLNLELDSIKNNPTRNFFANRTAIQNERDSLLMDLQVYQDAIMSAGTSAGRSLRLYGEFKSQEFNPVLDVQQWMKEDAEVIDSKLKDKIEKDVTSYEAARRELKKLQKEREATSKKSHYAAAVKAIKEILTLSDPADTAIEDDFRDMFRKSTKKSSGRRSQVDENNANLTDEQQAFKYTEIYKSAKRLIRAENLSTVEEVTDRVIAIFNRVPTKDTTFFAEYGEAMTIDPEDVRIALELGFSGSRGKRQNDISKTLVSLRRMAKASQALIDTESQWVDGNPSARESFAKQLHAYINSILSNGMDQVSDQDSLSSSMTLLSSLLNKYDAALVGRGVVDADLLAAARTALRQSIQVLGADLQADKVDVTKLQEAWQAKLIAEQQGAITSAAVSAQAPVGDGLTPSEREARRALIRKAQRRLVSETRKLENHRKSVERLKGLNDPSMPTWDRFTLRTEGLRDFFFESTRQVVFSFDLSFLGIQAGMNLMGMLPATAIDYVSLAAKGENPNQALVNLTDYGKNAWSALRWTADKGRVEDMYLTMISSRVGSEAMAIQPDFFSDPRKGADGSQREELVRAAFGQKLAQWSEDNQTAYGKVATAGKALGGAFSYFSDSYTMFMNYTRFQQYQSFLTLNPNATEDQKRIVLQNVMDNTGKGVADLAIERGLIGQGMSTIIAAPRLYLSYWKRIKNFGTSMARLGWSLAGKAGLVNIKDTVDGDSNYQGLDFAAIELVKQYASSAIGVTVVGGMLSMFGWEFEDDEKDRQFLKFKKEDKVIDISAGMAQYVRVGSWMHYTFVKSNSQAEADRRFGEQTATQKLSLAQRTVKTDLMNMAWYKLHPTNRAILTAITGEDAIGQTFGVTDDQITTNIIKQHLPITVQTAMEAFGAGEVRLDEDEDLDISEAFTVLGLGSINMENSLRDVRVNKYMNALEWTDGKEKKVGYAPTRLITSREAKKYITGSAGNYEDIVDSNKKKKLLGAFKEHAQHLLGEWILEEVGRGNSPTKDEIAAQAKVFGASVGRQYYEKYVEDGDFEFTQE